MRRAGAGEGEARRAALEAEAGRETQMPRHWGRRVACTHPEALGAVRLRTRCTVLSAAMPVRGGK